MGILGTILTVGKRVLLSAAKGAVDPVVAVGKGAVEVIKDNIASPQAGEGNVDLVRIFALFSVSGFGLAYIFDYITIEDLKQIAKILITFIV